MLKVRARFLLVVLVMALWRTQFAAAHVEEQWERNAALFRAARTGSVEDIQNALKEGADIHARTPSGETALVLAIMTGHAEATTALLDAGVGSINEILKVGKFTGTPLGMAAWGDSSAILNALLEHGADPKLNDSDALRGAIVTGSVQNVRALLAKGVDVNYRFRDGLLPLSIAAVRGHAGVCESLLDGGARINARSNEGTTALMFASAQAGEDAVVVLLKRGANVTLFDADGRTALALTAQIPDAAARGRIERLLVDAGASRDATVRSIDQSFLLAARQGDIALVSNALEKGAELEVRGKPNATLWLRDALSASVAHPRVCRLLLDRGINPYMRDGAGFTALHAAAQSGHVACIEALLKAGLNPNQKATRNQTPLYIAINSRRPAAVVAALLRGGADANGYAEEAKQRGLNEIAKLLEGAAQ